MENKIKITHSRHEHDWYVEPPECVEKLIKVEQFFGESILDPCCGQGTIPITLLKHGFDNVDASDLVDRNIGHSELKQGFKQQDFLTAPKDQKWDSIISNPPFKDAVPIIEEALRVTNYKVCMLLRLAFLESERRTEFFKKSPLARIWVMKDRVTMYRGDYQGNKKSSGTQVYAWFVFEHGWSGPTQIERI